MRHGRVLLVAEGNSDISNRTAIPRVGNAQMPRACCYRAQEGRSISRQQTLYWLTFSGRAREGKLPPRFWVRAGNSAVSNFGGRRPASGVREITEVQVLGYRERLTRLAGGRQHVLDPVWTLIPKLEAV